MASGHVNRIQRPNTWLHRPMLQNVKKALANPEPSTLTRTNSASHNGRNVALAVPTRLFLSPSPPSLERVSHPRLPQVP